MEYCKITQSCSVPLGAKKRSIFFLASLGSAGDQHSEHQGWQPCDASELRQISSSPFGRFSAAGRPPHLALQPRPMHSLLLLLADTQPGSSHCDGEQNAVNELFRCRVQGMCHGLDMEHEKGTVYTSCCQPGHLLPWEIIFILCLQLAL